MFGQCIMSVGVCYFCGGVLGYQSFGNSMVRISKNCHDWVSFSLSHFLKRWIVKGD